MIFLHLDEEKEAFFYLCRGQGAKVKPDCSSGQSQLLELIFKGSW